MTWRLVQLDNALCDQDHVILSIYKDRPVKYIGHDDEFAKNLLIDIDSKDVVAIFNTNSWLSDLVSFIKNLGEYNSFYLGINRYVIQGNDTNFVFDSSESNGQQLLKLVSTILPQFDIINSGHVDNDQGKYFNFIQPLTWIYAANKSHR
jgi:hypothetical protein